MPNTCSVDIKNKLEAAGVGTFAATTGWAIYIGKEPELPNDVIVIFDLPDGEALDGICTSIESVANHRIVIYSRSESYTVAYQKAIEVEQTINRTKFTVGNVRYELVHRDFPPRFETYDENNRAVWYQSYTILRYIGSSSSSSSSSG